jgi:hypothetical protein
MNKFRKEILMVVVLAAFLGVLVYMQKDKQPEVVTQIVSDEQVVRDRVAQFATKFELVQVTAAKAVAVKAIKDNYSSFVSPEVLAIWEKNPAQAPGRTTAAVSAQKIEVKEIIKKDDGSYEVQGEIMETSTNKLLSLVAMKLRNEDGQWIITGFERAVLRTGS